MQVTTRTRGRPTVFHNEVVHKLEQAFAIGCTVEEACIVSGVSRSAYYNKLNNDPDFMDRMARIQLFLIIKARHTVYDAIRRGDTKTSRWYLERKCRDEFGAQTQNHNAASTQLDSYTEDELRRIAAATTYPYTAS